MEVAADLTVKKKNPLEKGNVPKPILTKSQSKNYTNIILILSVLRINNINVNYKIKSNTIYAGKHKDTTVHHLVI